ncbi:MAG TPA: hypothetical protein VFS41_01080 [Edaphobacter sp.]|nr:hypothetical protein [Edaphobacter sp.]
MPKRQYLVAAWVDADFERAVKSLDGEPRRKFLKSGSGWHLELALEFSSGRLGTLVQWEILPATIEISLELVRGLFFYRADLDEVIHLLGCGKGEVSLFEGSVEWKGRSARTAVVFGKRVKDESSAMS